MTLARHRSGKGGKGVRPLFLAVFLAATGASLAAHDMWIEPTAFAPERGKVVGVRLQVGEDFLGDPLPRDPALIDRFISLDAAGSKPVIGRDGADPAGLIRMSQPGLLILGYHSRPSAVVLPAEKFNQYLKEEGLEAITAERARRGQSSREAREIFTRCAKSLLISGSPSVSQGDRRIGFTLELVAERNPYALGADRSFPVSLTYEGKPLSNALVVAMNRKNPAARLSARTDARGRVSFRLPEDGMWLIKAVHMVPAPAAVKADWASYWASLTFELKGPAKPGGKS